MKEATFSAETSAEFQLTTRRYLSEDRTLRNHRCENLKFYVSYVAGHERAISLSFQFIVSIL
jgi:hypothetical protein